MDTQILTAQVVEEETSEAETSKEEQEDVFTFNPMAIFEEGYFDDCLKIE